MTKKKGSAGDAPKSRAKAAKPKPAEVQTKKKRTKRSSATSASGVNGFAASGGSSKGNGNGGGAGGMDSTIDSVSAACIVERGVGWLWDGFIPLGCATLLTGEAQLGKSTLATAIVACTTTGQSLPGGGGTVPSAVVWLAAEEHPASIIRPRLKAAGAVLGRVHFPGWMQQGGIGRRVRFPSSMPAMRDFIRGLGAALVVIDPIGSFLDESCFEDSGGTARSVMQSLSDLASETGAAVMAIKHPRKGCFGAAIDQISGSKEWVNVARSVLVVAQHPNGKGKRILASVKASLGPRPESQVFSMQRNAHGPFVRWEGDCKLDADDIFGQSFDALDRDALAEAKELLKDRLRDEPRAAKLLLLAAEQAGISTRTLRRAKKDLGITSHAMGPNETRYSEWRQPMGGWAD